MLIELAGIFILQERHNFSTDFSLLKNRFCQGMVQVILLFLIVALTRVSSMFIEDSLVAILLDEVLLLAQTMFVQVILYNLAFVIKLLPENMISDFFDIFVYLPLVIQLH
jgi:hypothetical protein